jgi:hypothetical protein
MRYQLSVVAGDTAIRACLEAWAEGTALGGNDGLVFVTSNSATVHELQASLGSRFPGKVQVVHLSRHEGLEPGNWHNPALLPPAYKAFCFDTPAPYVDGTETGAQSRPEAYMRALLSKDLPQALLTAITNLVTAHTGGQLEIAIWLIVSTFRNTGSGALLPLLARLAQAIHHHHNNAVFQVNAVLATYSVDAQQEVDVRKAQVGGAAALTELTLAEELDLPISPELRRLNLLRQVLIVGAPPRRQGLLPNVIEAQRALAQVLQFLSDQQSVGVMYTDLLPTLRTGEQRKGSHERLRFGGVGALEIVLDPADAEEYLAEYLFAHLPVPK